MLRLLPTMPVYCIILGVQYYYDVPSLIQHSDWLTRILETPISWISSGSDSGNNSVLQHASDISDWGDFITLDYWSRTLNRSSTFLVLTPFSPPPISPL